MGGGLLGLCPPVTPAGSQSVAQPLRFPRVQLSVGIRDHGMEYGVSWEDISWAAMRISEVTVIPPVTELTACFPPDCEQLEARQVSASPRPGGAHRSCSGPCLGARSPKSPVLGAQWVGKLRWPPVDPVPCRWLSCEVGDIWLGYQPAHVVSSTSDLACGRQRECPML